MHFHINIIKHSNRPFTSVEEMNEVLAQNINKTFPNGGILYHLGDWTMGGRDKPALFKAMLRKDIKVILILGNHDKPKYKPPRPEFVKLFNEVHCCLHRKINGQGMWFTHYSHRIWPSSHHGCWHLYGHSHNNLPDDPHSLSFDVGVDCHNFKPLTFDEVSAIMAKKNWQPIDHHGRENE